MGLLILPSRASALRVLRFADRGAVVITGKSSPAWHRRQRRARAKGRVVLAACDRLLTPRALQSISRLQHHHGSTVPDLSRAIHLDQFFLLPGFVAMAWCCPTCNASNWKTRSSCYRCHSLPSELQADWQPQAQVQTTGSDKQGLTFFTSWCQGIK